MSIQRRLQPIILNDLNKKMVLLAGPRQCGKTTLAKALVKKTDWSWKYYNWDIDGDRRDILQEKLDLNSRLWILDELHKYSRWRNWLKGKFDQFHPQHSFLVTGSAKLDAYSRGGDSLQGRYYFHRLHPFTLGELLKKDSLLPEEIIESSSSASTSVLSTFKDLLLLGGFPEPFASGSEKEAARWRLSYVARLVREEIRSLEKINDLERMELLLDRLPTTVGSILSLNSLREDLGVAFETVRHWISVFENLYAVFRLMPFGAPRIKAVKKEQKLYFWDWSQIEDESKRLENCVALHLLKFIHWREDVEGEKWELRYFRDVHGHEVDFLLMRKGKPWAAIEVKLTEQNLDPNLKYFLERVLVPYTFQISLNGKKDWAPPPINGCKIRIMPAINFLANLI